MENKNPYKWWYANNWDEPFEKFKENILKRVGMTPKEKEEK